MPVSQSLDVSFSDYNYRSCNSNFGVLYFVISWKYLRMIKINQNFSNYLIISIFLLEKPHSEHTKLGVKVWCFKLKTHEIWLARELCCIILDLIAWGLIFLYLTLFSPQISPLFSRIGEHCVGLSHSSSSCQSYVSAVFFNVQNIKTRSNAWSKFILIMLVLPEFWKDIIMIL